MDGRLGVLGGLTLFQALAAEHAEQIGVGFAAMARRREFWLTVHCRIELRKPLALMDTVTGETWPEACRAESVRCFRSYRLRRYQFWCYGSDRYQQKFCYCTIAFKYVTIQEQFRYGKY